MASIIDHTYFKGDLNFPDIAPGKPQNDNLDWHINIYESEYLTEILGLTLYKEFNGELPNPSTQKYQHLLGGVSFTQQNGVGNFWCGFKGERIGENYKFSPIANYVYWQRMRQRSVQTVGVGNVIAETENSRVVTPIHKMVRAWNQMVKWNWILHEYMTVNKDSFPTYIGHDFPPLLNPPLGYELRGNQLLFVKQNSFGI